MYLSTVTTDPWWSGWTSAKAASFVSTPLPLPLFPQTPTPSAVLSSPSPLPSPPLPTTFFVITHLYLSCDSPLPVDRHPSPRFACIPAINMAYQGGGHDGYGQPQRDDLPAGVS